jgi:hypothetical protein
MTEGLERRLQVLEDIESLRRLKARYCQACDADHDPDAVAACFVEDGLWEAPDLGVRAKGRAAIRAYIGGVRAGGRMRHSAHMATNPIIAVAVDRASGQWRLLMMYTTRPVDGKVEHHRIIGTYDEAYARVDGTWLIERLTVAVEENGVYACD